MKKKGCKGCILLNIERNWKTVGLGAQKAFFVQIAFSSNEYPASTWCDEAAPYSFSRKAHFKLPTLAVIKNGMTLSVIDLAFKTLCFRPCKY